MWHRRLFQVGLCVAACWLVSLDAAAQPFTAITTSLPGVRSSSVAWGDYDNDGDLDVLVTGYTSSSAPFAAVYRNDGGGTFTDIGAGLQGVSYSSVAWGDYDNDGDLDILLTGSGSPGSIANVYRNDGGGVFTDAGAVLPGVYNSSVAWGDYDNDGDLDILLTGRSSPGSIAKVYRNDGGGVFTDAGAALPGVYNSSVAWGDYDNDGDLDILLTGYASSYNPISRVYRNDGGGVFTDILAGLVGVNSGSAAWGDYDNDGDLDVLLTGNASGYSSSGVAKIYRNDGEDVFTDIAAGLTGVYSSSAAWGDCDNDGDLDVLLAGYTSSYNAIASVYRNDGGDVFTSVTASLAGVGSSSVAWGDYDNDGDLDILLTGSSSSGIVANVYRNDVSSANAIPAAPSGLGVTGSVAGAVTLGWTGSTDTQTPSAGLTYNLRVATTPGGINILSPMASTSTGLRRIAQLGNANHGTTALVRSLPGGTCYWSVQAIDTAFAGSPFATEASFVACSVALTPPEVSLDYRGGTGTTTVTATDSGCAWTAVSRAPWITITQGASGTGSGTAGYSVVANSGVARTGTIAIGGQSFKVSQAAMFTDAGASVAGISDGAVAWGDYDNDGRLDLLVAGGGVTKLYRNTSIGVLHEVAAGLPALWYASAAWGDYDNDGDLDILLTGSTNSYADSTSIVSRVYRNDGGGVFTDLVAGLTGVYHASVAWGDYDNDGGLDILLTGGAYYNSTTKIYHNDGGGVFTDIPVDLPRVYDSSVAWGDYDNDGDLDILMTGYIGDSYSTIARVYRNDGGGVFTDVLAGLTGVQASSVAWGDYDNDGDLDILLTGSTGSYSSSVIAKVYRNDGEDVFTDIGAGLAGVYSSAAAWGDYDNDGDLDILLAGYTGTTYVANVYRNDTGLFTNATTSLAGLSQPSAAWGDYNNHGRLDIVLAGASGSSNVTRLYRNETPTANTIPTAPSGLSVSGVVAGETTLGWAAASDPQTPGAGLTYNLRLSTTPGGENILSPMSSQTTGWRRLPQLGNANHGTSARVRYLPGGTYYWSVQAVDAAFAGSPFATESSFVACSVAVNPASISVLSAGGPGTIAVTASNGTCPWTAVSKAPWITVTSGASGTGNGSVGYSIAVNSGMARTGKLVIGGQTVIVSQNAIFKDVEAGLAGISQGSVAWGDYDNDGDLDILLAGAGVTKIYRNTASGAFHEITPGLPGVQYASAAWGDYDNDGDLDFLLTGYRNTYGPFSAIYRNDGGEVFTDIAANLVAVNYGSVAWGDHDNDGDLDILLTGSTGSTNVTKIYRNDGGGVFTDIGAGLPGVGSGSVAWGDYDNDGDLDILMAGATNSYTQLTKVYRNDGDGAFVDIAANLSKVSNASVAWGDYDNDGKLDILLSGSLNGYSPIAKIYHNEGSGLFNEVAANLTGAGGSAAAWGDFDNDGDLDILLTGSSGSGAVTRVYRNDGGGVFTSVTTSLPGIYTSTVAWGDYDDDGDLDILLAGYNNSAYLTRIYRNDSAVANTPPGTPTPSSPAPPFAGRVLLDWLAPADAQTPNAGLTYNLRVSTTPGGVNILSPMASTSTGWRRVPQLGNAQHGTTAVLSSLPPGTYYWSVQAIDSAFAGSPFATESSFVACSGSIAPTVASVALTGGTGTVAVTVSDPICVWQAVSNASWITLTSGGGGGMGNGSVSYSVAANLGPARMGTITIAGRLFTIVQAEPYYSLSVSKSGTGAGTVTSTPIGIDCGATCSASFASGTVVALTAAATVGAFGGWGGACTGTAPTCQVTMSQTRNVIAYFDATPDVARLFTITPCRVLDTRETSGAPILEANAQRLFTVSGVCGIPADAKAIVANLTVVGAGAAGGLKVTGGHLTDTQTSTISFPPGRARANNAIVQLATDGSGTIAVTNYSPGTVHFILDVSGYFR